MNADGDSESSSTIETIEFEAVMRQALDEQAAIRRLEEKAARFLTATALSEFPALKEMTADQIREFGRIVTRTASKFALNIAYVSYSVGED